MSSDCDVNVIFPIYRQIGAIRNLGAESIKLTFSLKVTFCLTKNENRTKKSLTQRSNYCFE